MVQWYTKTLEDGRQIHKAIIGGRLVSVFDYDASGTFWWYVYRDSRGNETLAKGKCASADEAMRAAEQAAA